MLHVSMEWGVQFFFFKYFLDVFKLVFFFFNPFKTFFSIYIKQYYNYII